MKVFKTVSILFLLLSLALLSSCDETSQDAEPEPEPLEFVIEPTEGLSFMVKEAPNDFTWEYFSDNLSVKLVPGPQWNGEIAFSSLQIRDGEVINRSTTPPVSVDSEELTAGLSTEELFPGLVYVPGHDWGASKRWKKMNNNQWSEFKKWIKLDQWVPETEWVQGIRGSLSKIEEIILNEVDLSVNQTLVVVYAHPGTSSTDREVTTQPYGIIFSQENTAADN